MFSIKHSLIFLEIIWGQTGIRAEFSNGIYKSVVVHIKEYI